MTTSSETIKAEKAESKRKLAQEELTLVEERQEAVEAAALAESQVTDGTAATEGSAPNENPALVNRKRIEEQLDALKRREAELRRELAMADHPELEEAIRMLEGKAFAVARVEQKIAQGFSKSEERRRDTLDKKLTSLRDKRAELDAQIAELEGELATLSDRARAFEGERRAALEQLMSALATHDAALDAAGLEAAVLVPDVARWLPEIRALAEALSSAARA